MNKYFIVVLAVFVVGLAALTMSTKNSQEPASLPNTTHKVQLSVPEASSLRPSTVPPANAAPDLPTPPSPPTEQASSKEDRFAQYAAAKPIRANGLANTVRWLKQADVGNIPFRELRSKAVKVSSESLKSRFIGTREEAVAHLEMNVSMAVRPAAAFEDNEFFYFSGGNTAYAVTDFSKGLIISKSTGEISSW